MARPKRPARAVLLFLTAVALAGLGFTGCAGGQSGSEGLCGESDSKREMNDVFTTAATDEDAGVDEPDGARNEFVAGDLDDPEVQSAPTQCVPSGGN